MVNKDIVQLVSLRMFNKLLFAGAIKMRWFRKAKYTQIEQMAEDVANELSGLFEWEAAK